MSASSGTLTRREALKLGAGAVAGLAGFPYVNLGRYRLVPWSEQRYSARAIALVQGSIVIDMLSPLTLDFDKGDEWMRDPERFTRADWEPFRASEIDVLHPAIGIGGANAYESTHRFFARWNGFLAAQDELFMRIDSPADFDRVPTSGKVGIMLGLQNSAHFRTVEDVEYFHSIGQRVSQLTYNARNLIGNGATERVDGGVSDFGAAIIQRMNDVGMAVDVSHCGDRTTLDACEISERPVLFTHSNVRSLAGGHPRTKTDEAIQRMAETGGVMGITGVRMFVRDREPTTIEHVLDHFEHVARLVGVEHLGVGSDIDLYGYDAMPAELNARLRAGYKGAYAFREKIDVEGLDHPRRMFDLTDGLIRRGYGDEAIRGILGGNFKRVLSEIWTAAPAVLLSDDEIAEYVGRYVTEDRAMEASIAATSDGLTVSVSGEGTYRLVPESKTRFRVGGAPPGYFVEFVWEGGAVTRSSLVFPGTTFDLRKVRD